VSTIVVRVSSVLFVFGLYGIIFFNHHGTVFLYVLLCNAVSNSNCITLDGRITDKWWVEKNVEGNSLD